MDIPVRCFTCGKVVANKVRTYSQRRAAAAAAGEEFAEERILTELGLRRYCCRRMLTARQPVTAPMLEYGQHMELDMLEAAVMDRAGMPA